MGICVAPAGVFILFCIPGSEEKESMGGAEFFPHSSSLGAFTVLCEFFLYCLFFLCVLFLHRGCVWFLFCYFSSWGALPVRLIFLKLFT